MQGSLNGTQGERDSFRREDSAGYVDGDVNMDPSWTETVADLRAQVAEGNHEAMFTLAWAIDHGDYGLTVDYAASAQLYRQAAERGNIPAMNSWAYCLRHAEGTPRNIAEGVVWYRKAADAGLGKACSNMAICVQCNEPGAFDSTVLIERKRESLRWQRLATAYGFAPGMVKLGVTLAHADAELRNDTEATEALERARVLIEEDDVRSWSGAESALQKLRHRGARLVEAAMEADVTRFLNKVENKGASIRHARNAEGQTCLHAAAFSGCRGIIDAIYRHEPTYFDVLLTATDAAGKKPGDLTATWLDEQSVSLLSATNATRARCLIFVFETLHSHIRADKCEETMLQTHLHVRADKCDEEMPDESPSLTLASLPLAVVRYGILSHIFHPLSKDETAHQKLVRPNNLRA